MQILTEMTYSLIGFGVRLPNVQLCELIFCGLIFPSFIYFNISLLDNCLKSGLSHDVHVVALSPPNLKLFFLLGSS